MRRYASRSACPSAPAVFSHSPAICSPIFWNAAFIRASGWCSVMPFFASVWSPSFSRALDMFQPRGSAAAAALRRPACPAFGSAAKARWFTTTTFFGWKALVL